MNRDHFANKQAKIVYIFNRTIGAARKYLNPRYRSGDSTQFNTADEMIEFIKAIYNNLFRVREAKLEYKDLKMKSGQLFAEFYTEFLHLASEAQILVIDYYDNLVEKIPFGLQRALLSNRSLYTTYVDLSKYLKDLNQGQRRIRQQEDTLRTTQVNKPRVITPSTTRDP